MKKILLNLLAITLTINYPAQAMELEVTASNNNNNSATTPTAAIIQKLTQSYSKNAVEQLKKYFTKTNYPEKFNLHEQYVKIRLGKLAQVLINRPRKFTILKLVLQQLINPYQTTENLKNPSQFIKSTGVNKAIATINTKKTNTIRQNPIKCIACTSDNKTLFSGSWYCVIEVWNVADPYNPTRVATLDNLKNGHIDQVNCLILSAHNKTLFSGSKDGTTKTWNVADPYNPTCVATLDNLKNRYLVRVDCLALSSDSKTLFSGSMYDTIKIWNVADPYNPTCVNTIDLSNNIGGGLHCLTLSADNKTLFSGSSCSIIKIWNVTDLINPTCIATLVASKNRLANKNKDLGWVHCLTLSTDNKTLFSGFMYSIIKIWNVTDPYNPTCVNTIDLSKKERINEITCLTLSSDNKTLFSGETDGIIKIWNVADPYNPTCVNTIDLSKNGYIGQVNCLTLSSDNKTLFSGFYYTTIKIWNTFPLISASQEISHLHSSLLGIIQYFFIREIKHHRSAQTIQPKPLAISDPLLQQLFTTLPAGLQEIFINNKDLQLHALNVYKPSIISRLMQTAQSYFKK